MIFFFEVNSKVVIPLTLGTLEFSDPVTGELIYNSSFRRNAGYIAALDLAKDDPLYAAFAALWDHTGRFTFDAMTRKMQHCAETNLIAYLRDEKSKGNDILKNPGKFYVFSTAMSEAGCDIAALCDNCSHRSLPDIAELNIAAGDTTARTTIAMIPVTTPQPLSTAPFLRLTATELEEIGEIALEGNYF